MRYAPALSTRLRLIVMLTVGAGVVFGTSTTAEAQSCSGVLECCSSKTCPTSSLPLSCGGNCDTSNTCKTYWQYNNCDNSLQCRMNTTPACDAQATCTANSKNIKRGGSCTYTPPSGGGPTNTPVPLPGQPTSTPNPATCLKDNVTVVVRGDQGFQSARNAPSACTNKIFDRIEADVSGCNFTWSCPANTTNLQMCSTQSCPIKVKGIDSQYTGCSVAGGTTSWDSSTRTCTVTSRDYSNGATVTIQLTKPAANPTCSFSEPTTASTAISVNSSQSYTATTTNATSVGLYMREGTTSTTWTPLGTQTGTNPSISRSVTCTSAMAGKSYQVVCNASNASMTCTGNPVLPAGMVSA